MIDASEKPGPRTQHAKFAAMKRAASLPRLLRAPLEEVRLSEVWLPKNPGESAEAYALRRGRSFLLHKYEETCETIGDAIFAGHLVVDPPEAEGADAKDAAELDEQVAGWLDDFDLEGRRAEDWLYDAFQDALDCGVVHCLADHPQIGVATNLAEEQDQGARPYAVMIRGDDILQVVDGRYGGKRRLLRVNVLWPETKRTDEWGEEVVEKVLVLIAGDPNNPDTSEGSSRFARWEIHGQSEDGKDVIERFGSYRPHVEIPLDSCYTKRKGFMTAVPALRGLAEKNAEHWQSASHQRLNLDFARFAQLVGIGFKEEDKKQKKWGSAMVWFAPAGADMKLVETSGKALDAGRQHLEDCKAEMDQLAQKPLQKMGPSTAAEVAIEKGEAGDSVEAWALSLERFIEAILRRFQTWVEPVGSEPREVAVAKLVIDKSLFLSPQQIEMLKFLRENGDIDQETLLKALKESGQLPSWLDIDAVVTATSNERPKLSGFPLPLANPAPPPVVPAAPEDPEATGEAA